MNRLRVGAVARWLPAAVLTFSGCGDDVAGPDRGFGTVEVVVQTVGEPIDPNGYVVALSGGPAEQMVGASGTTRFENVPVGPRRISLKDVGVTCDPEGGSVQDITVQRFLTTTVRWSIVCTEKPIVFSSHRSNSQYPHLYRMNVDGSGVKQLGLAWGFRARWSPDGTKILYTDASAVYVMDAQGGAPRRLTDAWEGAWSPDGSRVVVSRPMDDWGVVANLFTLRSTGGDERALVSDATAYSPDWGPDGRIVFVEWSVSEEKFWLSIVDADGLNRTRILESNILASPAWSPDGSRIAFVGGDGMYTVKSDGTDLRRRSAMAIPEAEPRWFGDGVTLLFTRYTGDGGSHSELRRGPVDTSESVPISHFPGTDHSGDVYRPR